MADKTGGADELSAGCCIVSAVWGESFTDGCQLCANSNVANGSIVGVDSRLAAIGKAVI